MKRTNSAIIFFFLTLLVFSNFDIGISSTDQVQTQIMTFLTKVAGLDEERFSFSSFNVSKSTMMGSNTPQIVVNAILTEGEQDFTLAITIVNDKIVFYTLNSRECHNDVNTQISKEESLNLVKSSLQAYETNFDSANVQEFRQTIPTSISTQEKMIEKENGILKIRYSEDYENTTEFAIFSWIQKINKTEVPNLSITATIDKNGIITKFFDNTELYKVVISNDTITKEHAIALGEEHIQKYTKENGIETVSVESEFQYARDINSKRGDSYTLYPQWTISAEFSVTSKEGVYGYSVLIWADTGEVHHFGPKGMFLPATNETASNNSYLLILGIAIVIATLAITTIYTTKRKTPNAKKELKNRMLKHSTIIGGLILLCSLSMCQVCNASNSYIYGSRYNLPAVETDLDNTLAGNIQSASSYAGYTTYNWYGSSTTANNIYTGAYGGGSYFSISFHVGHGGYDGWMCFTWPWHYHSYVAMRDDSGSWVRDHDIYENSIDENPNSKKMVLLWSCHLGEDAMGEIINYPCGDEAHGMPLAWNHDTGLSSNGYTNPDSSGQVFIGFTGLAHWLSTDVWGIEDMGYQFLLRFYWATLCDGRTVNDGLDYASNDLWGVPYGSSNLDNGYVLDTTQSQMVVYGQGSIYI